VLRKRDHYRRSLTASTPRVACHTRRVERLLTDPGIIRNRLKVESAITNARHFGRTGTPARSTATSGVGAGRSEPPAGAQESPRPHGAPDAMSEDPAACFRFVGSTICYAFMQACGLVNDHLVGCFRHDEVG
jgi:DNA-3-methyladenine glycosylase I